MSTGPWRIAIGGLLFEGNSLSPLRNDLATFTGNPFVEGEAVLGLAGSDVEVAGALAVLEAAGQQALPLFYSHGGAGGRVTAAAWASLRAGLLDRLRAAMPVHGVYLALHGAMLTEESDDPEADLLEAVRRIVGSAPIAVSCDLHAHLTMRMVAACDILVGYQLYPHDDTFETGQRATGLLLRTLAGAITPRTGFCKLPMILQAQKQRTRGATPMREVYRLARAMEASGDALSASYFPVQSWMDVEDLGVAALAIADGDQELADKAAVRLARALWQRRAAFDVATVPVDDAIRAGLDAPQGFVVLADAADCVGGGAGGDSAIVLARLLAVAPGVSSAICVVDPAAAAAAHAAGEGARIDVALGNRSFGAYGAPVGACVTVVRLCDGRFTYRGGLMGGASATMGPTAWLRVGEADIVVASRPTYEYGAEQFQAAGFDPRMRRFVVVKNPMNYQQTYEGAAAAFLLDTPGPTTPALAGIAIPRARAAGPYWPFERDFQPAIRARPAPPQRR